MVYELISERKAGPVMIRKPEDAFTLFARYARARTERFMIATLNGAHDVIGVRIISIGLADRTVVHPREVFFPAIRDGALAIILCHNHPSGHLEPSNADLEITGRLKESGELLGITVLDHIIIGRTGFLSMAVKGLYVPNRE